MQTYLLQWVINVCTRSLQIPTSVGFYRASSREQLVLRFWGESLDAFVFMRIRDECNTKIISCFSNDRCIRKEWWAGGVVVSIRVGEGSLPIYYF